MTSPGPDSALDTSFWDDGRRWGAATPVPAPHISHSDPGAVGCGARRKGRGGWVSEQPRLPGKETQGLLSPYLLQHLSGKLQLAQLLLVGRRELRVGLCQAILLERPKEGQRRAGSAPALAALPGTAELVPGRGHQAPPACPISPAPGCSPAAEPRGLSWELTLPRWSPGSSGRCLPATHSPEQGGKDDRLTGGGRAGDWQKEGGERKECAHLQSCLQVLGEAGHHGPVLLSALDLLLQPLPGRK